MKDIFYFIQKPYNLRSDPELKDGQTVQCTLEEKAYLRLPQEYRN